MNTDIYCFKLGDFQCIAISDGTLSYSPPVFPPPPIFLFANAPRDSLNQVLHRYKLHPEQWAEWVSPYICLVVNTGKHLVLVDTGADGLAPSTGKLLQNLKAAGITPEDIDMVILTHGHPDHIGGNTGNNGKLAFPNAGYVMWKDEWEFWTSGQAEAKLDEHVREVLMKFARKNLPPIQGRLELVDHETEITPGIRTLAASGHTPGHMALAISSRGKELLCMSDTVLHPIQLEHPEWHAAIDFTPEQVVATRRRLLKRAATEKALVLAFHFSFPGLGYVSQSGDTWQWQPISTIG